MQQRITPTGFNGGFPPVTPKYWRGFGVYSTLLAGLLSGLRNIFRARDPYRGIIPPPPYIGIKKGDPWVLPSREKTIFHARRLILDTEPPYTEEPDDPNYNGIVVAIKREIHNRLNAKYGSSKIAFYAGSVSGNRYLARFDWQQPLTGPRAAKLKVKSVCRTIMLFSGEAHVYTYDILGNIFEYADPSFPDNLFRALGI